MIHRALLLALALPSLVLAQITPNRLMLDVELSDQTFAERPVTLTADALLYFDAAKAPQMATITAAGRTLLAAADAAAQRTALGLVIGSDVLAPNGSGSNLTSLDPHNLQQRGATDGQVLGWSQANNRYQPQTVSSGLTVGTTAITGGTAGRLLTSGDTLGELTLGTGVATALGVNTGSAGSVLINGGVLSGSSLPIPQVNTNLANPPYFTFPRADGAGTFELRMFYDQNNWLQFGNGNFGSGVGMVFYNFGQAELYGIWRFPPSLRIPGPVYLAAASPAGNEVQWTVERSGTGADQTIFAYTQVFATNVAGPKLVIAGNGIELGRRDNSTWNEAPIETVVLSLPKTGGVKINLADLPTTDPDIEGQLWRDGTDLKISLGP